MIYLRAFYDLNISGAWGAVLVLPFALAFFILRTARNRRAYPPGPYRLPFLGNLFDIPRSRQWLAFAELGRKLASLVHFKLLGTHIVAINDLKTAREILEKRGSPHISRPPSYMRTIVGGHDWSFASFPSHSLWKTCRRLGDASLRLSETRQFRDLELQAAQTMLARMLETPTNFAEHCHLYFSFLRLKVCEFNFYSFVSSIVFDIAYGLSGTETLGPLIRYAEEALHAVNDSTHYPFIDALPWLSHLPEWFPGMQWKTKAPGWRKANQQMRDLPFDAVKKALQNHDAKPSVATRLLEQQKDDPALSDYIIKATSATLISAGLDTVVAATLTSILLLSIHPHIQRTAQEELDNLLQGEKRLPHFDDKPRLPFVHAFCKELLRFAPLTPLCVPHCTLKDDVHIHEGKQYFIPKGSIVFVNAWAMTRDTEAYSNPEEFNPWRFLKEDGTLNADALDPSFVFGFRPRHCPGKAMAEDEIFIFVASFLAIFNAKSESSNSLGSKDFESLFKPGLVVYPRDFTCNITPRHEGVQSLLLGSDGH